ncbi:valine--tRNA ligase [Pontixanthobacter gangjinensis]|uniref:Valine--tRNA ligase n=1 Tax=Pontixanthobacter gangjinensis TaxID=1028742 RepID=A0A6I4SKV4_9SPHN|nr:valine--tRNA ligase [Pontixanthobacter gangjinensis]MXO56345.1 valine--tRNA ligase [Pontixanthobacter gangjinensis]
MTTELSTTFDPAAIEQRWYSHWEENGLFRPERPDAQPYTIVNPPPNVTGNLHIGHALDNTLQDIVIRYERLRGKDALWVVGMDHAGIATQMVVERQMEERQDKRTNYSREDFVKKVWEWKEESGGTITTQLRRLGCSMDWSREQFTMDPHFSDAVLKVFVDLYNDGLIYRDKRLVNWDPKLKTAISDLEVETQDVKGQFWHFKYPLADGVKLADGRDYIEVATTRPETMLADMAVAVHPDDERYASVVGKEVVLPITGRRVKIVADEHADPELGSGAVKITPGHDFNDFDVGKRAGFAPADMFNMLDGEANVCQTADGLVPDEFLGLHRFKRDGVDGARELVVQRLKELGFLIPHITKTKKGEEIELDSEPRTIATPFGDRGGVVIEPWLTDQWYVDAKKLAVAPMEAVRNGDIEIIPQSWEKTFFHWMENIQPWCVSRQLWWGHRIPAWFDDNGKVYVAMTEDEAQAQAGEGVKLKRDEDVLDTWFSSGLWPFATLGWPDENAPLYQKHYPNDLLISGFDILFFWDARMAMQGMHLTGQAPWKKLYLHGLVRAADGSKMSKSKGNVVDPLGLIDQYGADALRFFMASMESQGRDIKMDDERVKGYRNFATKLWNATRFCQTNGITASATLEAPAATSAVNRWIIGEVAETLAKLDVAMADLRFDAAANIIYHFAWDTFCDWYIELIKGNFDDETKAVAGWVLDQILVMLHPFMPFITEELWNAQGDRANYPLITAKWPEFSAGVDAEAKTEVEWTLGFIKEIRSTKAALGAAAKPMRIFVSTVTNELFQRLEKNLLQIKRLTRASEILVRTPDAGMQELEEIGAALGGDASTLIAVENEGEVQLVTKGLIGRLDFFGEVDLEDARKRFNNALETSAKEANALEGRLGNANFVERAKPEAVEKAKADHAHHSAEVERLKAALERLG